MDRRRSIGSGGRDVSMKGSFQRKQNILAVCRGLHDEGSISENAHRVDTLYSLVSDEYLYALPDELPVHGQRAARSSMCAAQCVRL